MEEYGLLVLGEDSEQFKRHKHLLLAYGINESSLLICRQQDQNQVSSFFADWLGQPGDVLVLPSLSCLGSSFIQINTIWRHIVSEMNVNVKVIDIPSLDTRLSDEALSTETMITLVNEILSFAAKKEIEKIRRKQITSLLSLKQNSRKSGRKPLRYPENWEQIYELWQSGNLTAKQAMEQTDLKYASFYNLAKRFEQENHLVRRRIHGKDILDL